jgi:hypothetical protein
MSTYDSLNLAFKASKCQVQSSNDFSFVRKHVPMKALFKFLGLSIKHNEECFAHASSGGRSLFITSDNQHVKCCADDCPFNRGSDVTDVYYYFNDKKWSLPECAKRLKQLFLDGKIETHEYLLLSSGSNGNNSSNYQWKPKTLGAILTKKADLVLERHKVLHAIQPDKRMIEAACKRFGDRRPMKSLMSSYKFASLVFPQWPTEEAFVCMTVGTAQKFKTEIHSPKQWLDRLPLLGTMNFLCPNLFKLGTTSKKRENLVSKRRQWLIVEGDKLPLDTQLACWFELERLSGYQMRFIVFSGKRSYHSWFDWRDRTEKEAFELYRLARKLGASTDCWKPEQYTRLVGGKEGTRERQRLIYWNGKHL